MATERQTDTPDALTGKPPQGIDQSETCIAGFDSITGGGIPRGRVTRQTRLRAQSAVANSVQVRAAWRSSKRTHHTGCGQYRRLGVANTASSTACTSVISSAFTRWPIPG